MGSLDVRDFHALSGNADSDTHSNKYGCNRDAYADHYTYSHFDAYTDLDSNTDSNSDCHDRCMWHRNSMCSRVR